MWLNIKDRRGVKSTYQYRNETENHITHKYLYQCNNLDAERGSVDFQDISNLLLSSGKLLVQM